MKLFRSFAFAALAVLSIATGSLAFEARPVFAQVDTGGLNAVGSQIGLSAEDPRLIAARVINAALGLLGIVMLVLILYAGFLWMTSGGSEEQVSRAKAILRNAIIGVVIILMSWALTTFVINALIGATTGGGPGGGGGGGGPGGGGVLPGGGGASSFQLQSISPRGAVSIRNIEVRFIFTRDVQSSTASSSITILRASDSAPVAGTIAVSGAVVTFTPAATCPAPNEARRCFDADTEYIARVSTSLRSTGGTALVCGGFAPVCEARFTTGSLVDTAPPTVTILSPLDGQSVPADDLVLIESRATDDAGVSYIESTVNGSVVGTGSSSSTVRDLSVTVDWDTSGVSSGAKLLMSRAHDIDSNQADSASISVVVRPRHCFNGTRDADETDVDCGGAACGACSGGVCTTGSACASGVCTAGVCVEQPVITSVSPDDGRPGTLVSISGVNFGPVGGTVTFADGRTATPPAACSSGSSWTPTLIIVAVPEGAIDGPITVRNAAGLSDATNDARGPALDNFDVNDVQHPGLCAAVPGAGEAGTRFELRGVGLGSSSDRVLFNDREVSSFLSWSDSTIALNAPAFSPATYAVKARVGGAESNAVSFRIDERVVVAAPVIDSVSPDNGPISEYITLQGRNFGSRIGRVLFLRGSGQGIADTDFPAECSTAFWSDRSVTVKVPRTFREGLGDTALTAGGWKIVLERQDAVRSNEADFNVTTGEARPGICAIRPAAGPVGTPVEIIGERFGALATGQSTFAGASSRLPMSVAASDWSATSIKGRVPAGSQTGEVRVRQGSTDSNGVNFAVRNCNEDASICGGAEVCCRTGACSVGGSCPASSPTAEFAWNLSTGLLPVNPRVIEECSPDRPASPSPWSGRSGGNRACVNSDLFIRFTTPLNPASIVLSGPTASFVVRRCTGAAENPCATAGDPVTLAAGYPRIAVDGDPSTGTGYVIFRPSTNWEGSATYQVILTTGIRSNTNVPMLQDYTFTFGTRPATETCRIGTVSVLPGTATLNDIGETRGVSAMPRSADDICLNLRADAYNWNWDTENSRVDVTTEVQTLPDGSSRGLENQTATGRSETGATPTRVRASVTQSGETITGSSDFFVRLQPPRVTAFGPNCDQACVNAAIWARFNVPMDEASMSAGNFILRRCTNENCLTYDLTLDLSRADISLTPAPASTDPARTYLVVEPTRPGPGGSVETLLEAGRFYRFTIRGGDLTGIRSQSGLPLSGLNDPDGFSWTFRAKQGDDARCATARVEVTPGEKYESTVTARQLFTARPVAAPDACNSEGSPLISDRNYSWTIDQTGVVSQYVNGGIGTEALPGLLDTTNELPAGCSGRCINMGSDGVDGRTASCGNGTIETTDANYCVGGRTPAGDACRVLPPGSKGGEECDDATTACGSDCRWRPVTGGTCGNGVVNRGEQCDLGPTGGRGCSADCQLLGARAGGSTCGNGDIAAGEACDDGNTTSGDGCSADCLHEGSTRVRALCGNGRLEAGETCERPAAGAAFPSGCNTTTCLNVGTAAPICGNAVRDAGEDCDDGNIISGDGCSTSCLAEGSSAGYGAPSFCGDSVRGRGEMCESAAAGDGRQDAVQLAEIVGEAEPGADGRMSSQLRAEYDLQRGQATYGLQCGFREETSCAPGTGLDARGCCAPRPRLNGQYPLGGETNVCRNALISGTFDVLMEEGSLQTNFVVAREVAGAACGPDEQLLVRIEDYDSSTGIRGWFNHVWRRLMAWFTPKPTQAAWCAGSVRGRLTFEPAGTGTKASFTLERALAATTRYQVLFRGDTNLADNGDTTRRVGVKSRRGVVADGNFLWDFTTGARLCSVTAVETRDTNADSPNLFTRQAESHLYSAQVISLQDGRSVALSPVAEYTWVWEPWIASNRESLQAEVGSAAGTENRSNVSVVEPPKNGSSFIEAGIRIVRDDVNVPSTTNRLVKGSQMAQVLLCDNPWPSYGFAPFSEVSGHPSLALLGSSALASTIRSAGPFFNFATLYCRDAGAEGPEGDLPAMNVQPVAISDGDSRLGILRQYLLTFSDPSLLGDGIGIRVATNPLHLTPAAWYASRGFTGSPERTVVDGYEAVKDGSTWYVGGVNTDDATGARVYSQMYIISHNPDAKPETKGIATQLVQNFALNANIQNGASNACTYAVPEAGHVVGEFYRGSNGQVARCSADWECLAQNPNLRCSSFKAKMQRDSKRIVDFQFMSDALETAKERSGSYPKLQTGSFVPTLSTSRWPSWQQQMQSEVGVAFPSDPVNRYLSCGVCSGSGTPCQDASECAQGQTCNAAAGNPGVEPATCWNPESRRYMCPLLTVGVPESVSRLYQYRSVNAGQRYELTTELEGAAATRYFPALLNEIKRCSNLESSCVTDADCRIFGPGGTVVSTGSCVGTGGIWRYTNVCDGSTVYGAGGGVCGDGVVGSSEVCELGDTLAAACTVASGAAGTKLQICDDCARYIDGPATTCVANIQCGNARVDAGETCDDGTLNGTYGRCNRTCSGYDAYCGDGRLSPGETCDLGATNGTYVRSGFDASTSCSLSCGGVGPRCGDSIVDEGFEDCDGNSERSTKALCVGGTNANQICDTNADCPGGSCPLDGPNKACTGITANRCSDDRDVACSADTDCGAGARCLTYPTSRSRTCTPYGSASPTTNWCRWDGGWSACQPTNFCGDGVVDAGEQCDDGNRGNNDACTNACLTNVCGDGFYRPGVEECDQGADNGRRTCDADYGSSCLSCSSSCRQVASSGGYCGNGVREGSEQCDGTQGLGSCSGDASRSCVTSSDCASGQTCNLISCRRLGFDYAARVVCGHYAYYHRPSTGRIVSVCRPGFACLNPCLAGDTDCAYVADSGTGTAEFTAQQASQVCKPDPAPCSGICLATHPPRRDVLRCASACSLEGCLSCNDTEGTGFIQGTVLDAVYSNQPVPNARVSLYNRGNKVDEDFTSTSGTFSFNTLNQVAECTNYRIIVDFYQDNPCTNNVRPAGITCNDQEWPDSFPDEDEGARGGYWPYESDTFGVNTFYTQGIGNTSGRIYLAPRVAEGETLVVHTWTGRLPHYIDAHLAIPESQRYIYTGSERLLAPPYTYYDYRVCTASDTGCNRDVNYGPQGNPNLDLFPHANLFCFTTSTSGLSLACNSFSIAPQTMKFKRGSWAPSGKYSYFLVDYSPTPASPSHLFFDQTSSTVRVITSDRIYSLDAPRVTVPPCTPTSGSAAGTGKYWLVFEQDAGTGAITLTNQLRCAGQASGQIPPVNLPAPLFNQGS